MSSVRDRYAAYFAEKLWHLLPAVYHQQDAAVEPPGQMRAFVEVLAQRAADLRLSNDRLADDPFVDLADDWVIAYLADLVATRLVSALNTRARRIDVAKTIYYRRRKGTPRVLEELIADITGWEGKLVEEFKRLGRTRHGLGPAPMLYAGRLTQTPPGGLANLRSTHGAALAGGPFDEFHYTPDVRRPTGRTGRYGISKLGFHLFRLVAYAVRGVMPVEWPAPAVGQRAFSIDPSGRDIQLFAQRHRSDDWDLWTSAKEWQLPAPIACRLLNDAQYVITENEVNFVRTNPAIPPPQRAPSADALSTLVGVRFMSERRLRDTIASFAAGANILNPVVFDAILRTTLIEDCGKAGLLPASASDGKPLIVRHMPGAPYARERTAGGDLSASWTINAPGKDLVVDPHLGRVVLLNPPAGESVQVDYCYGFSGPIGAGPFSRSQQLAAPATVSLQNGVLAALDPNGVSQFMDSGTYIGPANVAALRHMVFQAEDGERPLLRLNADWLLTAAAGQQAQLTIDGIWIGGTAGLANVAIVLAGDYESVTLRTATLDPGGVDAVGAKLPPVVLAVTGTVEQLTIERSIVGPIELRGSGLIERLTIKDSIVQSIDGARTPLNLTLSKVHLERVTILTGDETQVALHADELYASDTLIAGRVDIADTQKGCFRYSVAVPPSRVPHPHRSHALRDTAHFFTSTRFGDAGFGQISEAAPKSVRRGAENGSEVGAFCALINPIKADGLAAKVGEYMPFGLIPSFIYET